MIKDEPVINIATAIVENHNGYTSETLKLAKSLLDFKDQLSKSQEPLPPEFQKAIDDNFWDLV